jgi:hypothetical protein
MTQFDEIIRLLTAGGVEFVVVGGVAGVAHGAARTTWDLDVVYRRTPENLNRIAVTLAPYHPYPRGAPPDLPFIWDARTLQFGVNFTLKTDLGLLDLLGEITGGGKYEDVLPHSVSLPLFDNPCMCLDLDHLIETKRAAGRPKDFDAIAELQAIQRRRNK